MHELKTAAPSAHACAPADLCLRDLANCQEVLAHRCGMSSLCQTCRSRMTPERHVTWTGCLAQQTCVREKGGSHGMMVRVRANAWLHSFGPVTWTGWPGAAPHCTAAALICRSALQWGWLPPGWPFWHSAWPAPQSRPMSHQIGRQHASSHEDTSYDTADLKVPGDPVPSAVAVLWL